MAHWYFDDLANLNRPAIFRSVRTNSFISEISCVVSVCPRRLVERRVWRTGSHEQADFSFFDIVLQDRGRPLTRGRGLK
ncbi:MAG: hypothetical protein ABL901_18870, partial [Hyphomicrobiaceae bacterium]